MKYFMDDKSLLFKFTREGFVINTAASEDEILTALLCASIAEQRFCSALCRAVMMIVGSDGEDVKNVIDELASMTDEDRNICSENLDAVARMMSAEGGHFVGDRNTQGGVKIPIYFSPGKASS